MQLLPLVGLLLLGSMPPSGLSFQEQKEVPARLEKSSYFAFVDREYIFTLEAVSAGVFLLNFVSMSDDSRVLSAKQVRISLDNRKVPGKTFLVDTGDPKEPLIIASLTMRPRSSFGVRIQGDFGLEKELAGVMIQAGNEDFKLVPLESLAFESLVLKINRINLGSPNFRDDWQVLKLEVMGERTPVRRR